MASFLDEVVNSQAGALRVLEEISWSTNQKLVYSGHSDFTVTAPAPGFVDIEIRTGADPVVTAMSFNLVNVKGDITVTDDMTIEVLENPTIGTPGTTAIPIVNHNRSTVISPVPAAAAQLFSDPAAVSGGLCILKFIPAKAGEVNDLTDGGMAFILEAATNYIYRISKAAAPSANGLFRIVWLETTRQT